MLIIHDEQMAVLRQYMAKQFEDKILADVIELFPDRCADMEESVIRDVIQKGMKVAADYGIVGSADVARFIYLMFFFSQDFYENPNYPWAAEVLAQKDLNPTDKMDKLYELSEEQIELIEDQRK